MRTILVRTAWLFAVGMLFEARLFAAEQPPWKPFVAVTVTGSDGKPATAILTPGISAGSWVVIVNGTAPWSLTPLSDSPTPAPTPTPSPAEAAKKLAVELAGKLPTDSQLADDARKLADVYRLVADQIPAPIDTIEKLIAANRYAREAALGPARTKVWAAWSDELGKWLDAQRSAGTIRSISDCKPIWAAIGEGLATVKTVK